MERSKGPKQKSQIRNTNLTNFIFFPVLILIRIGDGIRMIPSTIFHLFKVSYNISSSLYKNSSEVLVDWVKEKIKLRKHPKKRGKLKALRTIPKNRAEYWKNATNRLLHIIHDASNVLQKRFRLIISPQSVKLPRITIPKISLPKIVFPKISFPFIRLPKIKIPSFSLPTIVIPTISFQSRPKQIVFFPSPITSRLEKIKSFFIGVFVTLVFIMIPLLTYLWLRSLPNPELLSRRDLEVSTKIFDRNGVQLYEIYADQNRTPIPIAQIPDYVKNATIAIEDKDFYSHKGFSVAGILRALRETLLHNRIQGGSTITQQLIKSALLTPEVKLSRKIKEIFLAFWAERVYSKKQILEMYLNQVPYGGTAWGIESASKTYFGKSVKDITLGEASLLAGLPAAPTEYSPFGSEPEKAFERQRSVLARMVEDHYVTKLEAEHALNESIHFIPPRIGIRAPHFVMYVRDLLEKEYGPRMIERGGLRVKTSLDMSIQTKVEEINKAHIDSLAYLRVGNGAAVVTNPKTGEILAMVGSKNYFDIPNQGNVNVTRSLRQPGSSIKVVNYAAALENGFTAASVLDDSPVIYKTPGSQPYTPVNYDGKYHGLVSLRYALGNSYNIPAVKTLAKIGVITMIDKGRLMGIDSWNDESRYGLSLTLGGGDVTMLEMAKVFGTLANEGNRVDLLPILEVTDYTGKILERNTQKHGTPAVKPEVAWILGNILSDNNARMSAFGPSSSLVIPGKTVSVKTGTSNDKRDNWTIGYTPSYVTAVWVGNNDNTPMDPYLTSGVTGAAPIWHDIMVELLKDKLDEVSPLPDSVVAIPCYFNRVEYFVRGTEPVGGSCAPIPTPSPTPSPAP